MNVNTRDKKCSVSMQDWEDLEAAAIVMRDTANKIIEKCRNTRSLAKGEVSTSPASRQDQAAVVLAMTVVSRRNKRVIGANRLK